MNNSSKVALLAAVEEGSQRMISKQKNLSSEGENAVPPSETTLDGPRSGNPSRAFLHQYSTHNSLVKKICGLLHLEKRIKKSGDQSPKTLIAQVVVYVFAIDEKIMSAAGKSRSTPQRSGSLYLRRVWRPKTEKNLF